MTRPIRQESAFRGATRYVPGCFEFRGFAARNRTARAAMWRVARFASTQGRMLVWVVAS